MRTIRHSGYVIEGGRIITANIAIDLIYDEIIQSGYLGKQQNSLRFAMEASIRQLVGIWNE